MAQPADFVVDDVGIRLQCSDRLREILRADPRLFCGCEGGA
jgi:hypothetical protein